jgi:hypothetical protein
MICIVIIMGILYFTTESMSPFMGKSSLGGSPYEGFDNALSYFYTRDPTVAPFLSGASPVEQQEKEDTKEFFKDIGAKSGKLVEGFAGLLGGPTNEDHGMMGYLAMNEARTDCKSFGYTKSTGNVCFSEEDIRLLTTRGGNYQPLK